MCPPGPHTPKHTIMMVCVDHLDRNEMGAVTPLDGNEMGAVNSLDGNEMTQ